MKACEYMTFTRPNVVARVARIEQLLRVEALTVLQLAERLHISKKTAHVYQQHLRPQLRIVRWDTSLPGPPAPMFGWGAGKDAKRPLAMTVAQKQAAYRKRLQKERPEAWIAKVNRERAARLKPRRDPMTAMLFGAAS